MSHEHKAQRENTDVVGPSAVAAGKRSLIASSYPALAKALGERDEPTIHDAATVAVERKGGGAAVDPGVAARVGAHLGADFSGVRVHSDALTQQATAAMGARAFAYGGDVFLGAGESGTDVGLMAHELTHVAQQGATGQRAIQRRVQVGDADSPAEREADQVSAAVTGGEARPTALLVDDGPVGPGQMLKSQFLEQLRAQVTAAADAELGPIYSAIGCPYIDQYFGRYGGQPASSGEALLRRFAPATRTARAAADMIPPVVARVRDGVRQWRDTGQAPPDLAAMAPGAGSGGGAATPTQAQLLRAPDGGETLASLEAELGPGQPLDGATASRMSDALGVDVSSARIHTGPVAARKAAGVGALAFAVGPNIVMGAGAPTTGTLAGDALLAHELAHTAQQAGAGSDPVARRRPIGAEDTAAEDNADAAAAGALAQLHGGAQRGSVQRLGGALKTDLQLQRCASTASWAPTMPAGTATSTGVTVFADGPHVDLYLAASPTVAPYVRARLTAGEGATGHVHFHPHDEFHNAWLNYASRGGNPETGRVFTQAEAEAWWTAGRVAGFQDGAELHMDQDRGQATDTIHESLHRFQNGSYVTRLGFAAQEGTTEYFTQRVCAEQTPPLARIGVYVAETNAMSNVIRVLGSSAAVGAAYFNGNISGLETAMNAGHPNRFRDWVGHMNRATPDYNAANALFP